MKPEFITNWNTQLKKGLLPFYVLLALQQKECYGYELIQNLKEAHGIDVTEGTIYPLLIRLMKEELLTSKWVEQQSGIPRKYYQISAEGIQTLLEMKNNIQQIFSKIQ